MSFSVLLSDMMETLEDTELCFPHLLNSSCRKTRRPQFVAVLVYITLSSISALTVTLNLLLIISISHYKQLQTPTNLLLLSLAVSDFFIGVLMVNQVLLLDGCWLLGDFMCALLYILDYTLTSASIGTMVLISIDRYVAVCCPLHYPTMITHRLTEVCVSLCWICSLIFHCVRLKESLKISWSFPSCVGECFVLIDRVAGLVDLVFSFIGPVTVVVVLYMRVFVVAVSHARVARRHVKSLSVQFSVTVSPPRSEVKAARTLGLVVVVFIICLCPYFCVALSGQGAVLSASANAVIINLVYFNSCLNPLIYAFCYPWFRKTIRLIVTLQILQLDSCEASVL